MANAVLEGQKEAIEKEELDEKEESKEEAEKQGGLTPSPDTLGARMGLTHYYNIYIFLVKEKKFYKDFYFTGTQWWNARFLLRGFINSK